MNSSAPQVSRDLTTLPTDVPPSAGASLGLSMAYLLAVTAATPLLLHRVYVKKKPIAGGREKRGHLPAHLARPPRAAAAAGTPALERVWIHAVSVGEVNAAKPLIARLRAANLEVILSTTTATGREVAAKAVGADACFFYPYDLSWFVQRAFHHLQPDLVVLMELEVWPNFMREACHRGVPVVIANGRITERSLKRYRKVRGIFGGAMRRCTAVLAQDDAYAQRFAELGVDRARLRVSGSLKYDAVDTALDPAQRRATRETMRAALRIAPDATTWVFGSIHPGEEPAIGAALECLRAAHRPVVPVIVPRHPERFDAIAATFAAAGYTVYRKKALDAGGEPALRLTGVEKAIVLGDTMGELKNIFTAADLAFVGGSFIPHGGQNPAEPVGLSIPCFCGPSMFNFEEIAALLERCGALTPAADGPALAAAVLAGLAATGADSLTARGERGRAALIAEQGATQRTVDYLQRLLAANKK